MDDCVSVIIPNYNNAESLEAAIDSCILQGASLKEIIVVDDLSTDNSLDLLKELKQKYGDKLSYYENPKKGGNCARNYGFLKSSGSYIQWLDADDILLPNKFLSQLSVFSDDILADVVYSNWYMDFYDNLGSFVRREAKIKFSYDDFLYEILSDNWSVPANYLFRRKIATKLDALNAWNPNTKISQDREYVTVAAIIGAKFSYTSGFYSVYNRSAGGTVSTTMKFKTRLGFQLEMESEFRKMLGDNISSIKFYKKYISVLNSHSLNACFYAPKLTIRHPFSIFNIDWGIIHFKKYPVIPIIYIWQHVKYFYGLLVSMKRK